MVVVGVTVSVAVLVALPVGVVPGCAVEFCMATDCTLYVSGGWPFSSPRTKTLYTLPSFTSALMGSFLFVFVAVAFKV